MCIETETRKERDKNHVSGGMDIMLYILKRYILMSRFLLAIETFQQEKDYIWTSFFSTNWNISMLFDLDLVWLT
mgnify:CR=1 FL=1